jgi:hypothetical protein
MYRKSFPVSVSVSEGTMDGCKEQCNAWALGELEVDTQYVSSTYCEAKLLAIGCTACSVWANGNEKGTLGGPFRLEGRAVLDEAMNIAEGQVAGKANYITRLRNYDAGI